MNAQEQARQTLARLRFEEANATRPQRIATNAVAGRATTAPEPATPATAPALTAEAVCEALSRGPLTGKQLRLALGQPDPERLYRLLDELLTEQRIETDPVSVAYYLPAEAIA